MSGRIGTCVNCKETNMGIYNITVERGWNGDKYNFEVEICEKCLDIICKDWKHDFKPDTVYIAFRQQELTLTNDELEMLRKFRENI